MINIYIMKIKMSLIVCFICVFNLCGQELAPYSPNAQLDDLCGEWKWEDGDNMFKVVFLKEEKVKITNNLNDEYVYMDILIGQHDYKEEGVWVNNFIGTTEITMPKVLYKEGAEFRNAFKDVTKNKEGILYLEYIKSVDGQPDKLRWMLRNKERVTISTNEQSYVPRDLTFSVPIDITLEKVN